MVKLSLMGDFSNEEKDILKKFISNVDSNIFVVKNLPEVVKGALFSRYSRSKRSLKRLVLKEFLDDNAEVILNFFADKGKKI